MLLTSIPVNADSLVTDDNGNSLEMIEYKELEKDFYGDDEDKPSAETVSQS